jgi:hypothetical protein
MDSIAALQASINRGFDLSGVYALAAEAQRQKQRQEAMAAMQSERAYRDGIRQQEWARQDARWDEEKAMRDAEIEARQAYETAVREENRSHQQAMQIAQNKFQARMLKERQQWEADQLQMRMDREENQLTRNTQDFLALNQQMQAAQQSALANSLEMAVVDPDVSIYISDKDRKIIDQARQGGSPISSVLGRLSSEAAGAIQTKAADLVQSNQELAMFGEALPLLLRQGVNWSQVAKAMAPKKIVTPNNENEDDDDTSYLNDYGKNNPSAANPPAALSPQNSGWLLPWMNQPRSDYLPSDALRAQPAVVLPQRTQPLEEMTPEQKNQALQDYLSALAPARTATESVVTPRQPEILDGSVYNAMMAPANRAY